MNEFSLIQSNTLREGNTYKRKIWLSVIKYPHVSLTMLMEFSSSDKTKYQIQIWTLRLSKLLNSVLMIARPHIEIWDTNVNILRVKIWLEYNLENLNYIQFCHCTRKLPPSGNIVWQFQRYFCFMLVLMKFTEYLMLFIHIVMTMSLYDFYIILWSLPFINPFITLILIAFLIFPLTICQKW